MALLAAAVDIEMMRTDLGTPQSPSGTFDRH
jgi:hypothetical protein